MRRAEAGRHRLGRKAERMRRTARNMLDSVRVRLTVWYSAVLAVVLVLVCATTYLIVQKTSMRRTDEDLSVLADSFLVTFQAELADATNIQDSAVLSAARQSMVEHRSNSDAFVVLGPDGKIAANSSDAITTGTRSDASVTRAFGSNEFQHFKTIALGKEAS